MLEIALIRLDDPFGALPWYVAPAIAAAMVMVASIRKWRASRV